MHLNTLVIPFKTQIGSAHHPMARSRSLLKNKTWSSVWNFWSTPGENQSAIYLHIIKNKQVLSPSYVPGTVQALVFRAKEFTGWKE